MSIFVDYPNNIFSNLSKEPTTLLEATTNTLWVNSIIVCNRGSQTIRFNLKLVKNQDIPKDVFLINDLSIEPLKSVDVLKTLGLNISLQYTLTPSVSDSLLCFSNGSTQIFDCTVNYTKLNELPIA